jgi:hypothetical protein
MKKYLGGQEVKRGVYLDTKKWELVQVYEQPVLPGGTEATYMKPPTALVILGGPVAGLIFVMFLPFAGIVGAVSILAYRAWMGLRTAVVKAALLVAPGWQPGVAYLARRAGKKSETSVAAEADKILKEHEREIAERRQKGEQ